MSDQSTLERRYRRLLAWFPREFQREQGEEILSVLMACAQDGQRRPGLVASADLIRNGLWMRLRPSPPRSVPTVRAAVWLMCTGAVVTMLGMIGGLVSLAFTGASIGMLRVGGRTLPLPVAVTVGVVIFVAIMAVWLWMARANSRGRRWACSFSTVLEGLATLHLFGNSGGVEVASAVTWLIGLAVVWLLWRPSSSAFFDLESLSRAEHRAA